MVTMSPLQSAVGSLAIDVRPAGTISCIWELADGSSGIVSEWSGVRAGPEFGRRPLVQLRKGQLLIGLRHISQLRRLLVVVAGPVPDDAPQSVVVALHGGATVESAHTGTTQAIVALAAYQVGGELVLRREARSLSSITEAAAAYGLAANWTPPPARRSD